ncbi:MAG: SRPBCC family protein [Thermomicrobiales bacterium]|nr:SRPBCC family protein [Thermomicrobiales bacterium]
MATVEKSIEIDLPVRPVYNQWTQFEEFPRFMEGVTEVRQIDDTHLHWKVDIDGKKEEWNAVITSQVPDREIAWRSTSGAENAGTITFTPLGPDRTRVTAAIGYEPEGVVEKAGSKLGVISRRVEGDLKRFKDFIESRGVATGAWRGEVSGGAVEENTAF